MSEILLAFLAHETAPGEVVCVIVGEDDAPDLDALRAALAPTGQAFFSVLAPALLRGPSFSKRGALLRSLPTLADPFFITDMSAPLPEALQYAGDDRATPVALVLVDGLSPHVGTFLSRLYDRLGSRVTYFGGGAGSLSLQQQPCIVTPEGVYQDAAVVLLLDAASELGVRHGWSRAVGPFVATRTEGTVVRELNWDDAAVAYREAVREYAGDDVWERGSFAEVAAGYPLGVVRGEEEDLVRDVAGITDDGALICVGPVPENTVLYVLQGTRADLLAAAESSVNGSRSRDQRFRSGLVADCASRLVYLQEDYDAELIALQALFDEAQLGDLEGLLTLGEIASRGDGLVEFHNKTVVTSVFYERE